MANVVYNEYLEHALEGTTDEFGNEIYKCYYPWTTKFYFNSKNAEKEYIDVDEEIYEEDVPKFCSDLRKFGVTAFTFSYEYSANQSIAKVIEENGFKLTKLFLHPVKEIEWYKLENGQRTEDTTQVPEINDVSLPAYYFELSDQQ